MLVGEEIKMIEGGGGENEGSVKRSEAGRRE